MILLICASRIARITSVSHRCLATILFLLKLMCFPERKEPARWVRKREVPEHVCPERNCESCSAATPEKWKGMERRFRFLQVTTSGGSFHLVPRSQSLAHLVGQSCWPDPRSLMPGFLPIPGSEALELQVKIFTGVWSSTWSFPPSARPSPFPPTVNP
jgi:hypothetical protein